MMKELSKNDLIILCNLYKARIGYYKMLLKDKKKQYKRKVGRK